MTTIKQHEESLKNILLYLKRQEAELARLEVKIAETRYNADLLARQLARAKRLGKTSFDCERFKPDPLE